MRWLAASTQKGPSLRGMAKPESISRPMWWEMVGWVSVKSAQSWEQLSSPAARMAWSIWWRVGSARALAILTSWEVFIDRDLYAGYGGAEV